MFPAASPPPDDTLRQAAELRAGGSTWEQAARKLGADAATVRGWAEADPQRWHAALKAARREVVRDGFAEAAFTIRRQLRSDDDRTARDAAGWFFRLFMTMLRHRGRPAGKGPEPEPAAAPHPFDEFGVSSWEEYDAAVERMMRDMIAKKDRQRAAPKKGWDANDGSTRPGGPAPGDDGEDTGGSLAELPDMPDSPAGGACPDPRVCGAAERGRGDNRQPPEEAQRHSGR